MNGGDPSRPLRLLAAGLSGVEFDGEREGYRNGTIASSTEELLHWPWPRRAGAGADAAPTDFVSLLHKAAEACGVNPADADGEVAALRARRERRDASTPADAATAASGAGACYGGALPWTERYRPESVGEFRCRSGGVPGTDAAKLGGVVALDLWLNEWKEKMQNEKESDTRRASQNSWWLEDDNSEDEDESAETTMLMYGPPGVGKVSWWLGSTRAVQVHNALILPLPTNSYYS